MRKISDMFDSYDGPNSEDDEESDPNNSLDPPQVIVGRLILREEGGRGSGREGSGGVSCD